MRQKENVLGIPRCIDGEIEGRSAAVQLCDLCAGSSVGKATDMQQA
jgi:hypothetical protein